MSGMIRIGDVVEVTGPTPDTYVPVGSIGVVTEIDPEDPHGFSLECRWLVNTAGWGDDSHFTSEMDAQGPWWTSIGGARRLSHEDIDALDPDIKLKLVNARLRSALHD